jgi:hypothetical protein
VRPLTWKSWSFARSAWRGISRPDREILGIWLLLRLLTALWAAFVSPVRPRTAREQAIALWPPTAPFGSWLERALIAPWERRDTTYYIDIVRRGYRADDGSAQFHPLLAWLATLLAWAGVQPLLALLLVSSLASALLLLAFERLARLDLDPAEARTSTLLLAFSPVAFALFAPYTEGLFLLWAVLCFLWARRRSWWLAGAAGALATLTRQQGVFLILPLAWELWDASRRPTTDDTGPGSVAGSQSSVVSRRVLWRDWLALGLIPVGLLIWLVYRAVALNDLHANLSDPHALIYSLLISPSASKVVPMQVFMWPWQALWLALTKFARAPEYGLLIDLALGFAFVALLVLAWRRMRISYRIWSLTIVLVSFGYHTGMLYPYMGLPRHLLLAFPVFIGLGPLLNRPRLRLLIVAGGLLGMLFLLLQYVIEGWVP